MPKTKPNQKCPCGSGKKFKKCCRKKIIDAENVRSRIKVCSREEYLAENPTALKDYLMNNEYCKFAPTDECIQMVLMNRLDTAINKGKIISQSKFVKPNFIQEVTEWNNGVAPVKLRVADKEHLGWENCCYFNAFGYACKYNEEHPDDPNARVVMGLNITALPDGVPDSRGLGRTISMETHAVAEVNGELIDVTPDFDGLVWKWFVPIEEWTQSCWNAGYGFKNAKSYKLYSATISMICEYVEGFSGTKGFVYNTNYKQMDRNIYWNDLEHDNMEQLHTLMKMGMVGSIEKMDLGGDIGEVVILSC